MKKKTCVSAALLIVSNLTFAGGLLTNTNQSVLFLRNPARDAAIGIDGVYSNPAGVVFLDNGFHLSLNIQSAHQTRTVCSTFAPFAYGVNNSNYAQDGYKRFKGVADAPVIPSVQAAYNVNGWSFQFGFAITGGGGKCEFEEGLGSFESNVALLPMLLGKTDLGITGYDAESYMRGRQYYYGFTFGAARKLNEHLSVYGGLRLLYGSANYYGYLRNIQVQTGGQMANAQQYFTGVYQKALEGIGQCQQAVEYYTQMGQPEVAAQYAAKAQELQATARQMGALSVATADISLNCDQTGWGVAPILGIDYKTGKFNFAAKYEFKTAMKLKNKSANSESAANIGQLERFADGRKVPEDTPALLTLGAQYEILPVLRVMAGYHHYFDKDAKSYDGHQKELGGNTQEFLAGAEWDANKWLQVSGGLQKTNYDFTDAYMNDISFNVSSWTFGFGVGIKVRENMKLNLAYFQTNYEDYNKQTDNYGNLGDLVGKVAGEAAANALISSGALKGADSFTRTNRVLGIGLDITF